MKTFSKLSLKLAQFIIKKSFKRIFKMQNMQNKSSFFKVAISLMIENHYIKVMWICNVWSWWNEYGSKVIVPFVFVQDSVHEIHPTSTPKLKKEEKCVGSEVDCSSGHRTWFVKYIQYSHSQFLWPNIYLCGTLCEGSLVSSLKQC